MAAATSQIRDKQSVILGAAEVAMAIAAGLDAINLAAALGGIPLPVLRRDNEPLDVEDATLEELQEWAEEWTSVLDDWDASHPEPGGGG